MGSPNQTVLSRSAPSSITVRVADGLRKNLELVKRHRRSLIDISVVYSHDVDKNKALDEAIADYCLESLTHITIENANKHSLSGLEFPNLVHLTIVGEIENVNIRDLVSAHPRLALLDIKADVAKQPSSENSKCFQQKSMPPTAADERIHKLLFAFKDQHFNAANLTIRISIGKMAMNAFGPLVDSLNSYLKGLRSFEIRCCFEWNAKVHYITSDASRKMAILAEDRPIALSKIPTKGAQKVIYIIKNLFAFFNWQHSGPENDVAISNFFESNINQEVEYKIFIRTGLIVEMVFNIIQAMTEKKKLKLYYDVRDENASISFIKNLHFDLRDKLNKSSLGWKLDFNPNEKFSCEEADVDFEGVTITLVK